MIDVKDGGPAFPYSRSWENDRKGYTEYDSADGMSLRDYFAGQALAGWAAHPSCAGIPEDAGIWAYRCADAMLKAREVTHGR